MPCSSTCCCPAASENAAGDTAGPLALNAKLPGDPDGVVFLTTVILPVTVTGIRAVMPALQFDLVLACTHWAGGAWQDVALLLLSQVTTAGSTRWPVASGVQGTVTVPTWIETGA